MSISIKVIGRFALSGFLCTYLRLSAQALWFEPNQGQVHPTVQFLARSGGGYVYFGRNRMAVNESNYRYAAGRVDPLCAGVNNTGVAAFKRMTAEQRHPVSVGSGREGQGPAGYRASGAGEISRV